MAGIVGFEMTNGEISSIDGSDKEISGTGANWEASAVALSFITDEGQSRASVELDSVRKVERSLKSLQSINSSNVSKGSDVPLIRLYEVPLPLIEDPIWLLSKGLCSEASAISNPSFRLEA